MRRINKNGKTVYWKTIIGGAVVSLITTLLLCAVFSGIIINGYLSESAVSYATLITLIASTILGCSYSFVCADKKKLVGAVCAGVIYMMLIIIMVIVLVNVSRFNVLPMGAVILGCSGISALVGGQKGRGRGKRRTMRMVKLNKKQHR